jgi:hypothetical protein
VAWLIDCRREPHYRRAVGDMGRNDEAKAAARTKEYIVMRTFLGSMLCVALCTAGMNHESRADNVVRTCSTCNTPTCAGLGALATGNPNCGNCSWPGDNTQLSICQPDNNNGCQYDNRFQNQTCVNGFCSNNQLLLCTMNTYTCNAVVSNDCPQ